MASFVYCKFFGSLFRDVSDSCSLHWVAIVRGGAGGPGPFLYVVPQPLRLRLSPQSAEVAGLLEAMVSHLAASLGFIRFTSHTRDNI